MKDNYIISITGTQTVDGETDKIEVLTTGKYEENGSEKIIRYVEYSAEDPTLKTDTEVVVKNHSLLTITRKGELSSQLVLEKGRRHQCHYRTPVGDMMIGVFTSSMSDTLSPLGGELKASYTLDFFGDAVSENEFYIKLKPNTKES